MLPGSQALLVALVTRRRPWAAGLLLLAALPGGSLAERAADSGPASVRKLLAADRWREALAAARALAAEQPEDGETRSVLGEALYRSGRMEEAEAVLTAAPAPDALPARGLVTLALVRKAQARSEEASVLAERAVAADPTDRYVTFWAADAAASSARSAELFDAYVAIAQGDDPDRIVSARESSAFLHALGDRRVWIPVERPDRLEAPLRPYGEGGRVRGYLIDATLGAGKPVRLLLDTGSSGLFLLERVAKRFGLAPLADATTFGGGGEQRHRTRRAILPSFAIGSLRFKDALVSTTTEEIEPTGKFQGVLGVQFLAGYRVTLDLERNRLLLEPGRESSSGEPYWSVSGQLLVRAGDPDGRDALFSLDTGAAGSVVAFSYVTDRPGAGLGRESFVRGFGGRIRGTRAVRGVRLVFQGTEAPSRELVAADLDLQSRLSGVELSGFVGLDLLSGNRIVIDTRARRVEVVRPARR